MGPDESSDDDDDDGLRVVAKNVPPTKETKDRPPSHQMVLCPVIGCVRGQDAQEISPLRRDELQAHFERHRSIVHLPRIASPHCPPQYFKI